MGCGATKNQPVVETKPGAAEHAAFANGKNQPPEKQSKAAKDVLVESQPPAADQKKPQPPDAPETKRLEEASSSSTQHHQPVGVSSPTNSTVAPKTQPQQPQQAVSEQKELVSPTTLETKVNCIDQRQPLP